MDSVFFVSETPQAVSMLSCNQDLRMISVLMASLSNAVIDVYAVSKGNKKSNYNCASK